MTTKKTEKESKNDGWNWKWFLAFVIIFSSVILIVDVVKDHNQLQYESSLTPGERSSLRAIEAAEKQERDLARKLAEDKSNIYWGGQTDILFRFLTSPIGWGFLIIVVLVTMIFIRGYNIGGW